MRTAVPVTVAVVIMGLSILWAASDGGLRSVTGPDRYLPIYCVDSSQPEIALTFNGAWGPDFAEEILDILASSGAKATFFVLNVWLTDNEPAARRVVDEGHEIAMHSATHADFTVIGADQIRNEIRSNCIKIVEVTGCVPRLFRAPSGAYDNRTIEVVSEELGFPVIQWNADSVDWQRPGAQAIIDRIQPAVVPGSIILFHTNVRDTVQALPRIIELIQAKGLKMVTVSDLLLPSPTVIDHNGCQRRCEEK